MRLFGEQMLHTSSFDWLEGPLDAAPKGALILETDYSQSFETSHPNLTSDNSVSPPEIVAPIAETDAANPEAFLTQPTGAFRSFFTGAATDTKFSSDGTKLYVAWGNKVTVYSAASGLQIGEYAFSQTVGSIDLSANGLSLAVVLPTGNNAGHAMVSVIALQTGAITAFDLGIDGVVRAGFSDVAFQSNGRLLLSQAATLPGTGSLVDLDPVSGATISVSGPAWGSALITSGNHSQIFIIEPTIFGRTRVFTSDVGLTAVRTLYPDPYAGASIPFPQTTVGAVSANFSTFIQAESLRTSDSNLTLWSGRNFPFTGNERGMIFSPAGDKLYVLSAANLIIAFDIATWQPLAVYDTGANFAIGSSSYGDLLQLSADGRYLAVTGMTNVSVIDLVLALPAGTNGNDTLTGNGWLIGLGGNDMLDSTGYTQFDLGSGNGQMFGGTGDDTYIVDSYSDEVVELSGEGYDTILLSNRTFFGMPNFVERITIVGTGGTDVSGNGEDNRIDSGAGSDTIRAGSGNDLVYGNGGADTINGGYGNDTIDGGADADFLVGDEGGDTLIGGDGNDTIYSHTYSQYSSTDDSGTEIDTVDAGAGDDTVWIGYGDSADGGAGTDRLSLSLFGATSGITLNTASMISTSPFVLGGGTIVNFEVLARLRGTEFADNLTVSGISGTVTVDGGGDNDVITATTSPVIAFGGQGNDRFVSGSGADSFNGGDGFNTVDYSAFGSGVTVTYNTFSGVGPGGDTFSNVQEFIGSEFADALTGGQLGDRFLGNGGADLIVGGYGVDTLFGGSGEDTIYSYNKSPAFTLPAYGDPGTAPVLDTDNQSDTLDGGAGNDTLFAGAFDNVDGGADFDSLYISFAGHYYYPYTGITADFRQTTLSILGATITNVEHVAWFQGSSFADTIRLDDAAGAFAVAYGGSGNDNLTAGLFTGSLSGEYDDDTLDGSTSQHLLFLDGGIGNDRLIIGSSNAGAVIDGGADSDTLAVSGAVSLGALVGIEAIEFTAGSALTLTGAQFNSGLAFNSTLSGSGSLIVNMATTDLSISTSSLVLAGGSSIALTINGSTTDEAIKGARDAVNTLSGGGGADQIRGANLGDIINGGDGDDKVIGANGADIMTGGAGADTFRFQAVSNSGLGAAADQITDFVIGTDRLGFQSIDADAVTPGDQAFSFLGTAAFSNTGVGQIRYQTSGADLLVQVDADGNGVADMEIVLQGLAGQTLTSGDFLL